MESGICFIVEREEKSRVIDISKLSKEERNEIFMNLSIKELLRTIDILCDKLEEIE